MPDRAWSRRSRRHCVSERRRSGRRRPRSWLKRNRKGIWYARRDVPSARFRRAIDFIEVAGPPAGGDAARAA